MKDYKFLIGLHLYLVMIHYSIFIGYVYGNYKNYNVSESVIISTIVGILSPFFLPIYLIIDILYKDKNVNVAQTIENFTPNVTLDYLCPRNIRVTPIKFGA